MKEEVKIPSVGESIVEGILTTWFRENGDYVREDEDLYEFETEKASVVVPSPFEGGLEILIPEGTKVEIGQVVARIDTDVRIAAGQKAGVPAAVESVLAHGKAAAPVREAVRETGKEKIGEALSPAVRRVAGEHDIDLEKVEGSGKDGRITKGDVLKSLERKPEEERPESPERPGKPGAAPAMAGELPVRRTAMSAVRKSIARHLLTARQEAAHLTTFNEINMENLMGMRKKHQEIFVEKHGIKLGMMSFFVKAAVEALKEFPVVNARIEGDDIVYYDFYDIGVAVSTDRGLIVPVIRSADKLGFADIEKKIADLSQRARDKKITLGELQGGTFSITNGGIFGSLMSTPIPNHPQPAILGMHAIQDRPVAISGEVKIKPMMYVALTYDHRLIDGREAVSFLFRIKEYIEDPEKLLLYI